jgi:hypothetical protein
MAVNLSPVGNAFQFFSNDGLPLAGGKLQTYQAGSTTPLTTYTDSSGLIANTNPIILGTDGRPPSTIWLEEGFFYKFVLSTASDVVIQTYDNLYGFIAAVPPVAPSAVPAGCILLWSGSIGSIPAGWQLCNGTNGTPDLRDKFIVGAGSTYAVDATGGSANAIVVSHTHTATSTTSITDPGHAHRVLADGSRAGSPGGFVTMFDTFQNTAALVVGGATTGSATSSAGSEANTTGITASTSTTNSSTGSSGTNANLPPYYALCYIQKT